MRRILVIEDNDEVRSLIVAFLTDYTVFEAANGQEGLAQFQAEHPELVITDLIMPIMGGAETIAELHKLALPPKIIVMSGSVGAPEGNFGALAAQLGVERMLPKPFRLQELRDAVEQVLAA
jgi:CheY-like chemotaxis protein